MELQTIDDFAQNGESKMNQSKLRFHFFHKTINQEREDQKMRETKSLRKKIHINSTDRQFEWDTSHKTIQRLYLSRDTKRMLEIINNAVAVIYTRSNVMESKDAYVANDLKRDVGQLV